MNTPFGLGIAPSETEIASVSEPSGGYDADQQMWIGDTSAEAVWGCTKFTVQVGPIKITYGRLLFDTGPIGCSY